MGLRPRHSRCRPSGAQPDHNSTIRANLDFVLLRVSASLRGAICLLTCYPITHESLWSGCDLFGDRRGVGRGGFVWCPAAACWRWLRCAAALTSVYFGFQSGYTAGLITLVVMLVGIPLFIAVALRLWPHTPIGKRVILKTPRAV